MNAQTPVPARNESYGRLLLSIGGVLVGLVAITVGILTERRSRPEAVPVEVSVPAKLGAAETELPPPPAPPPIVEVPREAEPAPPKLDTVAVARAEAELDAASRDRARAEARAENAAQRLRDASTQAALDARNAKNLAFRIKDPSTRVRTASRVGGFLKGEVDKLKKEVDTLAQAPRPKAKVLSNQNPVARPAENAEHHFELRHDRVTYVPLDRLMELVKADAMLRIKIGGGGRAVESRVGPVGGFSLEYALGRSIPAGLDDLVERRGVRYDLRGWEIVPEFEGRGETYEATRQPISDYARTINRLTPTKNTITMWIYPDSFALFRRLRDDLHTRGFMVAARPLPMGMAIRGSPSGSLSAGQ